jgi:hypothetical protein
LFVVLATMQLTPELSDSRRQERRSARSTSELPPSVERSSGAAVRSSDLLKEEKAPGKFTGLAAPQLGAKAGSFNQS